MIKQNFILGRNPHEVCQKLRENMFNIPLVTHPSLIAPNPSGWNELLIASFSHRSINSKDGVLLASELQRDSANSAGVGAIFDRYEPRGNVGVQQFHTW